MSGMGPFNCGCINECTVDSKADPIISNVTKYK